MHKTWQILQQLVKTRIVRALVANLIRIIGLVWVEYIPITGEIKFCLYLSVDLQ